MILLYLCVLSIIFAVSSAQSNFTDDIEGKQQGLSIIKCPLCYCGIIGGQEDEDRWRIVGGWPSEANMYPWMVALVHKARNKLFCGGTLIADIYVLTAAHCLRTVGASDIEIVFSDGDHVDMMPGIGVRRSVSRVIIHQGFNNMGNFNNDIALLKLSSPFSIGRAMTTACLPFAAREDYAGDMGRIIGWGLTSEGGMKPSWLQVAQVPILSQRTCSSLAGLMRITPSMMCAAPLSGGVDACQGDSGGPLMVKENYGRFTVAGIVSWGIGCARPNKPGIYTRVNHFLPWIYGNTFDGCFCF